jgi:hypothetical protein
MLLHFTLCRYRVHKVLVTKSVIDLVLKGQGEGE